MKAQEGKTEKEVRVDSLKKKMAHDKETVENIQKKEENDQNGYGNRDYENDPEESKEGVNNHHNQRSSNQPVASNNSNSSQRDRNAQAQNQTANYNDNESDRYQPKKQGLSDDGKSYGGSDFKGNHDKNSSNDRNYDDHETVNAQFQQVQGESSTKGNNFDSKYGNQKQSRNSNDVIIAGPGDGQRTTSEQAHGNTSGYDQGHNSNEGMKNLQNQKDPQMRYGGSEYDAGLESKKESTKMADAHSGIHKTDKDS